MGLPGTVSIHKSTNDITDYDIINAFLGSDRSTEIYNRSNLFRHQELIVKHDLGTVRRKLILHSHKHPLNKNVYNLNGQSDFGVLAKNLNLDSFFGQLEKYKVDTSFSTNEVLGDLYIYDYLNIRYRIIPKTVKNFLSPYSSSIEDLLSEALMRDSLVPKNTTIVIEIFVYKGWLNHYNHLFQEIVDSFKSQQLFNEPTIDFILRFNEFPTALYKMYKRNNYKIGLNFLTNRKFREVNSYKRVFEFRQDRMEKTFSRQIENLFRNTINRPYYII